MTDTIRRLREVAEGAQKMLAKLNAQTEATRPSPGSGRHRLVGWIRSIRGAAEDSESAHEAFYKKANPQTVLALLGVVEAVIADRECRNIHTSLEKCLEAEAGVVDALAALERGGDRWATY